MSVTPPVSTVGDTLSLALVASSDAPLLLLNGDLSIIAASRSFCDAFHVDEGSASGSTIFTLGSGEWGLPKLRSLLTATASGQAAVTGYEIDLKQFGRQVRRLVIKAQKLNYGSTDATRLLVTIIDMTEALRTAKEKDDLLREKAVLMQQIQHRVANSLQIIASVLMQSARNVQSDKTRTHLNDARNRVMSIATVQKQLASSTGGEVRLRPYLAQLCESLGASMIHDRTRQTIEVATDDTIVPADTSVSLGLIVTELVINALKHAFPNETAGKIMVNYSAKGAAWVLSVSDNGVGMTSGAAPAKSGLGTNIVDALAGQLRAKVTVSDRKPGTSISVTHVELSALEVAPLRAI